MLEPLDNSDAFGLCAIEMIEHEHERRVGVAVGLDVIVQSSPQPVRTIIERGAQSQFSGDFPEQFAGTASEQVDTGDLANAAYDLAAYDFEEQRLAGTGRAIQYSATALVLDQVQEPSEGFGMGNAGSIDAETFFQRLKAFVVTRPGCKLNEADVQAHVKRNLARYKVPREVVFVESLPRNATGKVLKRELRQPG